MEVVSVQFEPSCGQTGCWTISVVFTTGSSDVHPETFNSFFLPYAVGSDALSYDYDYDTGAIIDSFVPAKFPCRSSDYVASGGIVESLPFHATGCCFGSAFDKDNLMLGGDTQGRGLLGRYRVTEPFAAYAAFAVAELCPDGEVSELDPKPEQRFPDGFQAGPHDAQQFLALGSKFVGLPNSPGVTAWAARDAFVGQYEAEIKVDQKELQTLAGLLKGTAGVESSVDTFLGFATFKPASSTWVLDSTAAQTAIHLEQTSFFSISTHGVNDYTFLEYINLRLVAVYENQGVPGSTGEAAERAVRINATAAAHYIQVTFTLGAKYEANNNSGLIPLDSVRAGTGTFIQDAGMLYMCSMYRDASMSDQEAFEQRFEQDCAPAAAMCDSPDSIPDGFATFNIPLGIDSLGASSASASRVVFVDMVISAVDTAAQQAMTTAEPNAGGSPWQMKTTLTASIPVLEGGVNIFCDQLTAKTDLTDVANVDIILGSASSLAELRRLRVLENVASSQLHVRSEVKIDSDSIEAGLMTLVLKGNASFFNGGSLSNVSLELEDVMTIHIMESLGGGGSGDKQSAVKALLAEPPDDNFHAGSLATDGYNLNGAFHISIDRSAQRAHLEPSARLLMLCPFSPSRPQSSGSAVLESCVLRRDVRFRDFPWRIGAVSTAMEISPAAARQAQPTSSVEAAFFTTILGDSAYARQLAADYAGALGERYHLDGRFRRGFWVNPCYEWTPTQTGGAPLFQLSQSLFLFVLITLDEHIASAPGSSIVDGPGPHLPHTPSSRRRALLAMDPSPGDDASLSAALLPFPLSRLSVTASAFDVPTSQVVALAGEMELTRKQACLPAAELQSELQDTLLGHLQRAASGVVSVHVVALAVSQGVDCAARRRTSTAPASATLEVLLVFSAAATPAVDFSSLAALPRIASISLLNAPTESDDATGSAIHGGGEQHEEGGGADASSFPALVVAAVCCGALAACVGGVLL